MTMNITNIGAHIKVANFEKSVKFYTTLGFTKVFEYGPDKAVKEDYNGMVFGIGDGRLEIADGHRAVKPAVFSETVPSSKISLMINVDNVHNLLNICKKNKISLAVGPRHYYWNTIEMVLIDPDGARLVFIAPYSKEEAAQVKADEAFVQPINSPN